MSKIEDAFQPLSSSPSPERLETFASQVESLSKMLSRDDMKSGLIFCISKILREDRFSEIRQNEAMLCLYKMMSRYSTSLGGRGIFEQLHKKGHFKANLKFYLQWAEECAKVNLLDKFEEVLNLTRDTLSATLDMTDIESGFRDLVDEYFDGKADHLFQRPDDTMNLFRLNPISGNSKAKRRSSVCFLQHKMPTNKIGKAVFGPKTRSDLRKECIDNGAYHGISVEEFRLAMWKDAFGEEVEQKKRKDSGYVFNNQKVDPEAREAVENRMIGNLNPRRRHLSAVVEKTADEEEEKRSRIKSPLVPTKDAQRPPLRNSVLSAKTAAPPTITLSSDSKATMLNDSDIQDITGNPGIDSEKMKLMSSGRTDNRSLSTTTSSTRTAKSGAGLDLMAENNCLEAHAMFSDTVHIGGGNEKTLMIGEDSDVKDATITLPPTTQTANDYSVFCDPDPTLQLTNDRPKKTSTGLNMVYDEAAPEEVPEEVEQKKNDASDLLPPKSLTTPTTFDDSDDMFHEDVITGFSRPSRGQIVTSTPAQGVPFVDVEAYFGVQGTEKAEAAEPKAFTVPTNSTLNRLIRRKSQAASAPIAPAAPAVSKKAPQLPNSSMDCLTENLGRRLSLGADEMKDLIQDEAETTGIKNRRRSEIIKQGDINPWDENLRKKLMNLVRPPVNMHEFPERAPKIQALRDCEVGGEVLHIQTLIGQGGYAKVYRAVNEDRKTVAVKYEVPSCAWEVYICDQMRNRLIKDGGSDRLKMADWCIMQVMDAYVFSTASLLVNEYHEYGTLLEYANHMKDPNWHMTCFLITQMARIIKEVHACKIIHGDIKPDNFMITRKIDPSWGKDALLSSDTFVVKIIDWGRAIDMMPLKNQSFKGRAGTEGFDSPEMIDGRSWTYQADYFGFAATMAVVVSGKYAQLTGDAVGSYSLNCDIKRRNILREAITKVISQFLNIPSCDQLPDWSETIRTFAEFWETSFDVSAWRQSISKFNEACDEATKTK